VVIRAYQVVLRSHAIIVVGLLSACHGGQREATAPPRSADTRALRSPADFASIADRAAQSRAIFGELALVVTHPRCLNCHPADDSPRQGMDQRFHDPPVVRGPDNHGVVAMTCTGCHQDRNLELARVPGAPKWALAPKEMAWMGRTQRQICEQMKDPKRNGGRSLADIAEHNAHDELVGWGWHPGADREPAPGTQAQFGALVRAWIDTGAECPEEGSR
jgi:hypothetical protein